ncbi:hypothetical protein JIR001_27630 [Polycladomyces abyssicola]|uniref:Uncharacterized protein n=1 Tax=Polycladomyces abyssicola TaxID=1125966 RepID=A0A8D5ZNQ7_9BACL|nr:hypothetical protein JIR001_27630 [Polycladomyces abyssicola]
MVIPKLRLNAVVFTENELFETHTVGFGIEFVVGVGFEVIIGGNDSVDGIAQHGDVPEGTTEIAMNPETAMTVYTFDFLPLGGGQVFYGFLLVMGRVFVDLAGRYCLSIMLRKVRPPVLGMWEKMMTG